MHMQRTSHSLTRLECCYLSAAHNNNIELIKNCLAQGVNVNVTNDRNQSALSIAFENDHYTLAEYLVEQNTIDLNVGIRNQGYENSPLQYVYSALIPIEINQRLRLITKLLKAGAHTHMRQYFTTALDCALSPQSVRESAPLQLLIDAKVSLQSPPNKCCPFQYIDSKNNLDPNTHHLRALLTSYGIPMGQIAMALNCNIFARDELIGEMNEFLDKNKLLETHPDLNFIPHVVKAISEPTAFTFPNLITSKNIFRRCLMTAGTANALAIAIDEQKKSFIEQLQSPQHFSNSEYVSCYLQTFNYAYAASYVGTTMAGHYDQAISKLGQIIKRQETYKILFSYYRTRKMIESCSRKPHRDSKLLSLPADILKLLPVFAAQENEQF